MKKILLVSLFVFQAGFWDANVNGAAGTMVEDPPSPQSSTSVEGENTDTPFPGVRPSQFNSGNVENQGSSPDSARKRSLETSQETDGEETNEKGVGTISGSESPEKRRRVNLAPSRTQSAVGRGPCLICHSQRGCDDARVYRKNLQLSHHQTPIGEDAVKWHQKKEKVLMDLCREIGSSRGDKNLALAGVRLIYREEDILKETSIIDIEEESKLCFFSSGQLGLLSLDVTNEFKPIYVGTAYNTSNTADLEQKIKIDLEKLKTQAEKEPRTFLSRNRLDDWYGNGDISLFKFSHSEIGLRRYLKKQAERIMKDVAKSLPHKNLQIVKVFIHIVTLREMCENCAVSYFLDTEQGGLAEVFKQKLKSAGFTFVQTGSPPFGTFMQASGLVIHYKEDGIDEEGKKKWKEDRPQYLNCQISQREQIDIEKFPPHIAHSYLPKKNHFENLGRLNSFKQNGR